ncbi:MAG: hypothetical protein ACK6DQ_01890, partial [Planctomycetota bacterium]
DESVLLAECLNALRQWPTDGIQNCKQRLAQPIQEWNPPPWITGSDLIQAGLRPGPVFGKLLAQARSMQLDGKLTNQQMAIDWLRAQIEKTASGQ